MTKYRRALLAVLAGAIMLLVTASAVPPTATSADPCADTRTSQHLCTKKTQSAFDDIAGHLRYTVRPRGGGTFTQVAVKACDTDKDGLRIIARVFEDGSYRGSVEDANGVGGCGRRKVFRLTGRVTVDVYAHEGPESRNGEKIGYNHRLIAG